MSDDTEIEAAAMEAARDIIRKTEGAAYWPPMQAGERMITAYLAALGAGKAEPVDRAVADAFGEASNLKALVDLIREEAAKDNAPLGRSDTVALTRIRAILEESRHER